MKLHIGCGDHKLDGWINADFDPRVRPDVVIDVSVPLPYADGSIDYVFSEDMIALLGLTTTRFFLQEVLRVLRPGGVFRLLTPDLRKTVRTYLEAPEQLRAAWDHYIGLPLALGTPGEVLQEALRLCGTFHYDSDTLTALARDVGFSCKPVAFRQSAHAPLRDLDIRDPDTTMSMYHELSKP